MCKLPLAVSPGVGLELVWRRLTMVRLAASLVTKVISTARQVVLTDSQCSDARKEEEEEEDSAVRLSEPSSPQVEVPPPPFPCHVPTTPAPLPGPETKGQSRPLENRLPRTWLKAQTWKSFGGLRPAWSPRSAARHMDLTESLCSDSCPKCMASAPSEIMLEATPLVLPKIQAKEGIALIWITLGQGVKEGRGSMVEAGWPPLLDVNSMDLVDSSCCLGVDEDQRTCRFPSSSYERCQKFLLPNRVPMEVIIVNKVLASHVFVQQHPHPTYHALHSLDQQMFLPATLNWVALQSPVEVGMICAALGVEGSWWRVQVISYNKDSGEVELRYVDHGSYDIVKVDTLR